MLFGALSTMTVFAVERANIDLLIFALAALAGVLLLRGPARAARRLRGDRPGGADQVLSRHPVDRDACASGPAIHRGPRRGSLAVLALFAAVLSRRAGRAALASVPRPAHYFTGHVRRRRICLYGLAAIFPLSRSGARSLPIALF